MSEGLEVIVDSIGNTTMGVRVEKEYGIDLDMTSVLKVVQVASRLKKTTIAVGGWQMEIRNAFRDETSTLHQDLGKLEERVARVEKGQAGSDKAGETWEMLTGGDIDGRLALALKGVKGDLAETCGGINREMRALQEIVKNNVKVVSKEARDNGQAGQLRQEMESKCNEQKEKAEAYTTKVEDVVKDLVVRIKVLERQNRELDDKNRDFERRVERVAQEKRQKEEAQVERMSERVREVIGDGAQRKRLGEDEMAYEGHSGKLPHGNSAERTIDGMILTLAGIISMIKSRDKQELKLAIGVFRGQYATAGVGDQIALIAKSVPTSVIPGDLRRDDYRFGVLVMTFRSYTDRDAFTQEWSAGYKNSLSEREGLKLQGIGEDF
ncbi:hypothetical protein GG344DRAFT_83366 [Lentinula edodes]|nr:hypothetical protein GG344DRAFT_83366 [Lentinula edodes]